MLRWESGVEEIVHNPFVFAFNHPDLGLLFNCELDLPLDWLLGVSELHYFLVAQLVVMVVGSLLVIHVGCY